VDFVDCVLLNYSTNQGMDLLTHLHYSIAKYYVKDPSQHYLRAGFEPQPLPKYNKILPSTLTITSEF